MTASEKAGNDALFRMDANDPDCKPFISRGGKLLLYHGWADPLIAPRNTVNYYQAVLARLDSVKKSAGGAPLHGARVCCTAPAATVPARSIPWPRSNSGGNRQGARKADRIPYDGRRSGPDASAVSLPQVAAYKGTGSTDQAENFVCAAPARN